MFYKFVQGDEPTLLDIFEKAVGNGGLKFSSPLSFNDPFEFKFKSIAPSRKEYDAWHREYDPDRSPEELERGWSSFSGPAADWNTRFVPRQMLLGHLKLLCLAGEWNSHLMWGHYAADHRGYAIIYDAEIVKAVGDLPDFEASAPVAYATTVPDLRWFQASPSEMVEPLVFTKSDDWSYEKEFRLILSGECNPAPHFVCIDPTLVLGVILGSRSPERLIQRALDFQSARPDFLVQGIRSNPSTYSLERHDVTAKIRRYGHML